MAADLRPQPGQRPAGALPPRPSDRTFELKSEIHRKLIGALNLERVASVPRDRIRSEIRDVVEQLLADERVPMTTAEQNRIIEEVLDEVLGLGPSNRCSKSRRFRTFWYAVSTRSTSSARASFR